ncbi:hypothetical protein FS749_016631 [Ceratobasidium sp. UAMH 11750]|nr:hypothetical protein FS749_016631 [Ceratobasidium sp. UAMH 11750]
MAPRMTYPAVRRGGHIDTYQSKKNGSVKVLDPYRYLEGKGQEVDDFVQVQSKLTAGYIAGIAERSHLEDSIRKSSNYTKFSAPTFTRDGRYYWNYNSGLQAQYVLYRSTSEELPDFTNDDGKPGGEVFFDPNYLTKDGTAALATSAFSKCGQYFAYGISLSGSDFSTIYVRKTSVPFPSPEHKEIQEGGAGRMDDEIKFVKFSGIVWTPDSKGFFYQRYPARASHAEAVDAAGTETDEDKFAKLYYHRLGTPQEDDILVMKNDDEPNYMWSTSITSPDGRYLALYVSRDTARQNLLWITDLEDASNPIGPNMKWIKLINEWDAEYSIIANDGPRMYIKTNKDAPNHRVVTIDISDAGRVAGLCFKPFIDEDPEAPIQQIKAINEDTWAIVYSRDVKDELYLYDKHGKRVKRLAQDHIGVLTISGRRDFHQLFVTASGFTNPGVVYLYEFANKNQYGETWHLAGTRERKPNVFDDFIAATQYLVDNKYAAPGKVVINGGSNGGLLVVACVNRAPQGTFGAAIAEVGVFDYLRFPQFTIGKAWTSDYGDPSNPEDFDFMYPISPLHNVDKGDKVLPPMLLLTADHDDRVVPLHSFKQIAELQYRKPKNPHPLLIRIDQKSGHGAGKSTEKRIVEAADKWAFAAHTMGLKYRLFD